MKEFIKKALRFYLFFSFTLFLVRFIYLPIKIDIVMFSVFASIYYPFIYVLLIIVVHVLKIDDKIFGNIKIEFPIILFILFFDFCFMFIANRIVDNPYVMAPNGQVLYEKWFVDEDVVSDIKNVALILFFLIHGRMNHNG